MPLISLSSHLPRPASSTAYNLQQGGRAFTRLASTNVYPYPVARPRHLSNLTTLGGAIPPFPLPVVRAGLLSKILLLLPPLFIHPHHHHPPGLQPFRPSFLPLSLSSSLATHPFFGPSPLPSTYVDPRIAPLALETTNGTIHATAFFLFSLSALATSLRYVRPQGKNHPGENSR